VFDGDLVGKERPEGGSIERVDLRSVHGSFWFSGKETWVSTSSAEILQSHAGSRCICLNDTVSIACTRQISPEY